MPDPITGPAISFLLDYVNSKIADDAIRSLMRGRNERARAELAAKMAKGRPWLAAEDDTAAALFTYVRAAQEGAARLNLRLMAEAMTNAAQEPTFSPDVFRHNAASLASLSRDEARLLTLFARANREAEKEPVDPEEPMSRVSAAWKLVRTDQSGLEIHALAGALTRTGWIIVYSGFGAIVYGTSKAFDEIIRLVDFEAELSEAGSGTPSRS